MPRLDPPEGLPRVIVSRRSMAENLTASWRNLSPKIDQGRCNGCMICWKLCPDAAVEIVDGKPKIDFEHCKGCGICAKVCPAECVAMEEELR